MHSILVVHRGDSRANITSPVQKGFPTHNSWQADCLERLSCRVAEATRITEEREWETAPPIVEERRKIGHALGVPVCLLQHGRRFTKLDDSVETVQKVSVEQRTFANVRVVLPLGQGELNRLHAEAISFAMTELYDRKNDVVEF